VRVHLGLGGNVGDRAGCLAAAFEALERGGVQIRKKSPIYETEPVGCAGQGWFLNQAVRGETELSPWGLLTLAKNIESAHGRRPGPRNAPRPIDIDILFLDDAVLRTETLVIPHPRLAERRFVLVPLNDIAPRLVHPVLGRSIRELLRACPDCSKVRLFGAALKKRPGCGGSGERSVLR
jgi:2-amino-4-hydroxy-6-hydroxymethyldihydropteridine diphosphokinase